MLIPTGFWSYSTSDDESSRGRLSQLRALLAAELQQQIGRAQKVNIFQDVAAIPPGRKWAEQIRVAIEGSSFIIPVITPGFLQSEWCCREIELFRQREAALGRSDLVFPVHYLDTDYVDGSSVHDCYDRNILDFLRSRQFMDFRHLRLRNYEHEEVALFLEKLARGICSALRAASRDVHPAAATKEAATLPAPRLIETLETSEEAETTIKIAGVDENPVEITERVEASTGTQEVAEKSISATGRSENSAERVETVESSIESISKPSFVAKEATKPTRKNAPWIAAGITALLLCLGAAGGLQLLGNWKAESEHQRLADQLEAAGFDHAMLLSFQSECAPSCPEDLMREQGERLQIIAAEATQYRDAHNPEDLQEYAQKCKACEFKAIALQTIAKTAAEYADVGWQYEHGDRSAGIVKDLTTARYDYEIAAQYGNQKGKEGLARLGAH